jgi:ferritin
VEEEKAASDLVDHLKLIGNQGDALLMLDREMATRTLATS